MPLLIGAGVGVGLVLTLVLGVALYQGKGLSQEAPEPLLAASQSTPSPQPTLTPETSSRLCQREVTQALMRMAMAMVNRADTNHVAMQEFMRLDPLAYEAYKVVLNNFMIEFSKSRHTGAAGIISGLMGSIQKMCARAQ